MGALHDKMNSSERENEPKALGKKKMSQTGIFFLNYEIYIYFFKAGIDHLHILSDHVKRWILLNVSDCTKGILQFDHYHPISFPLRIIIPTSFSIKYGL